MVMLTDEALDKFAAEHGVQPLAHTLQVKLAGANDILENIAQDAFFEKMSQAGYVVNNDDEATELLNIATMLEQQQTKAASEQSRQVYKAAGDHLRRSLGIAAPEAASRQQAVLADYRNKTAALTMDDDVVAHLLARYEASQLLNK